MVKSWYPEWYPCFGRHQACGLVFPYIKYACYSTQLPRLPTNYWQSGRLLWVLIPNPLKQWDSCFSHSTVELQFWSDAIIALCGLQQVNVIFQISCAFSRNLNLREFRARKCIWHQFSCDMGLDGTLTSHIERVAITCDI